MPAVVPSYLAKLSRAEKHLIELHRAIDEYAASHPYTVCKRIEGKKKTVHRLVFTALPENTDIPIIAADVIYNLRSALDHLMSCLVANSERTSVIFPVMFQGVWEDAPVVGEDAQRAKLRARWKSDTRSLGSAALAVLQALQPSENTRDESQRDRLQILNSLSNRDRHEKLPVTASGLDKPKLLVQGTDGRGYEGLIVPDVPSEFAHNDARLDVPEDAVKVQIEGTPLVVVRVGEDKAGRRRYVPLPGFLDNLVKFLKLRAIDPLIPHVRR